MFCIAEGSVEFLGRRSVPVRLFVVANQIGGQVVGAFDGKELSALRWRFRQPERAFLSAFADVGRSPAVSKCRFGTPAETQSAEDALALGFDLMEWTFDPLEIKNAYLNIEKLGAIARRYNVNQYGITTSPCRRIANRSAGGGVVVEVAAGGSGSKRRSEAGDRSASQHRRASGDL